MKNTNLLDGHVGNRDAVPTGRIPTVKLGGEIASPTGLFPIASPTGPFPIAIVSQKY